MQKGGNGMKKESITDRKKWGRGRKEGTCRDDTVKWFINALPSGQR